METLDYTPSGYWVLGIALAAMLIGFGLMLGYLLWG